MGLSVNYKWDCSSGMQYKYNSANAHSAREGLPKANNTRRRTTHEGEQHTKANNIRRRTTHVHERLVSKNVIFRNTGNQHSSDRAERTHIRRGPVEHEHGACLEVEQLAHAVEQAEQVRVARHLARFGVAHGLHELRHIFMRRTSKFELEYMGI